jgi:hypothetical protein
MLRNRPLLIAMLVLFTALQAWISRDLMAAGFDWRPLWGAPIVKAAMLDFTFTATWCAFYLLDAAKRQGRNGWAWMPLLLILPTFAVFLFSLTEQPGPQSTDQEAARF